MFQVCLLLARSGPSAQVTCPLRARSGRYNTITLLMRIDM